MQTRMIHSSLGTPLRHFMVVARKGQITIPAPIREALDIKEGDTIAVELQGKEVTIIPIPSTLAAGYQSLPALKPSVSWKETEHIAHEEQAENAMRQTE